MQTPSDQICEKLGNYQLLTNCLKYPLNPVTVSSPPRLNLPAKTDIFAGSLLPPCQKVVLGRVQEDELGSVSGVSALPPQNDSVLYRISCARVLMSR